jgi:hypothetical protein
MKRGIRYSHGEFKGLPECEVCRRGLWGGVVVYPVGKDKFRCEEHGGKREEEGAGDGAQLRLAGL